MNELVEKQYEYILSIIEMNDYTNVSDMELNVIVFNAVCEWQNIMMNAFNGISPNSSLLKQTFGNYENLIKNVIKYAYNIFMRNENNNVAKYICSYLGTKAHRDVSVSGLVNELHTSIKQSKTR